MLKFLAFYSFNVIFKLFVKSSSCINAKIPSNTHRFSVSDWEFQDYNQYEWKCHLSLRKLHIYPLHKYFKSSWKFFQKCLTHSFNLQSFNKSSPVAKNKPNHLFICLWLLNKQRLSQAFVCFIYIVLWKNVSAPWKVSR